MTGVQTCALPIYFDQVFLLHAVTRRFIPLNVIEALAVTSGTTFGALAGHDAVGVLVGATAGALAGTTLGAVVTAWIACTDHRLRPQWGAWGRILIACAAMAAVLQPIPWPKTATALTAEIVLGIVVYGAVIAALFPEIRRLVMARIRRNAATAEDGPRPS